MIFNSERKKILSRKLPCIIWNKCHLHKQWIILIFHILTIIILYLILKYSVYIKKIIEIDDNLLVVKMRWPLYERAIYDDEFEFKEGVW